MKKSKRFYVMSILFIISCTIVKINGIEKLMELETDMSEVLESTVPIDNTIKEDVLLPEVKSGEEKNKTVYKNHYHNEYSPYDDYGLNPTVAAVPKSFFETYFIYIVIPFIILAIVVIRVFFSS